MLKPTAALFSILLFAPALSLGGVSKPAHQNTWQGVIVYSAIKSMGSGVPVSQCHVLTNEHVVRGGKTAKVVISGEHYDANIVSIEHDNDMALLKIPDCPITRYAKVAPTGPKKGDVLTSVYYKPGFNLFKRMTRTRGVYKGTSQIMTEEDKSMVSMVIEDPRPRKRSSGGGVSSEHGLVSVIFGIASKYSQPRTYAVHYPALKSFLLQNRL